MLMLLSLIVMMIRLPSHFQFKSNYEFYTFSSLWLPIVVVDYWIGCLIGCWIGCWLNLLAGLFLGAAVVVVVVVVWSNNRNVRHPLRGPALIFIYSVDSVPCTAARLPRWKLRFLWEIERERERWVVWVTYVNIAWHNNIIVFN